MVLIIDPIYGHIKLDADILPLIDNPYFQRLRGIKQNSTLFFVYPSAKQDRFSHSIGAYHLMRKVVENGQMDLTQEDKFHLKAAALLHDIGHGPYSHLWERLLPNYDHEEMSKTIIREVFKLPVVADIIAKKHPYSALLSSVVDVDKLDYMSRDSYFCGVGYGRTDTDRIVQYLYVKEGKLCVPPKIVTSLEHVITGRISLYKSVYFHHLTRAIDANLTGMIKRVRDLFDAQKEVFMDEVMKHALQGELSMEEFLLADDALLEYHIKQWKYSSDTILADLVKRFLSRKGFKAINTREKTISLQDVDMQDFEQEYYFFEDKIDKSVYESEIYIESQGKFIPLTEYSPYIKAIAHINMNEKFIIGPREVLSKL